MLIRINAEQYGRQEISGTIRFKYNQWQLFTFKHSSSKSPLTKALSMSGPNSQSTDRVTIEIDAVTEFSETLPYPFGAVTCESEWIIGIGFKGFIASAALYNDELSNTFLQLLYNGGPEFADISEGVSSPQNSFDTGHITLGSRLYKGTTALKASRLTPLFCIKPFHFAPDSNLSQKFGGKNFTEHIEMALRTNADDIIPTYALYGDCVIHESELFSSSFMQAGGCPILLYLIWTYTRSTTVVGLDSKTNYISGSIETSNHYLEIIAAIKEVLKLISSLLRTSNHFKEQLIQMHGFHVLGSCLSDLPAEVKYHYFDSTFVEICVGLLVALGPDSNKGDGIAALLQGFLFDFRIWCCCQASVLSDYLASVSSLLIQSADVLNKSIGVQRLLDIFRLHIAHLVSVNQSEMRSMKVKNAMPSNSEEKFATELDFESIIICADAMQKLIATTLEGAKYYSLKTKFSIRPEIEAILICLEETNSFLVGERILNIFKNLRQSSPEALRQAMISLRFQDTIVVSLLSKRTMSVEIRLQAVLNLFWLVHGELSQIPVHLIKSRKILRSIVNTFAQQQEVSKGRRSSVAMNTMDSNRVKSLNMQILQLIKPLGKMCYNLINIVKMLEEGLMTPVLEGKVSKYMDRQLQISESNPSTRVMASFNYIIDCFSGAGPDYTWLVLIFLPSFVQHCSLESSQVALMAINVALKTEENQREIIASLSGPYTFNVFIELVGYFESKIGAKTLDSPSSLEDSEKVILSTCVELTLDSLVLIIEHKIRCHYLDSVPNLFKSVEDSINSTVNIYTSILLERRQELSLEIYQKCIAILLQRVGKYHIEAWNITLCEKLHSILSLVEKKTLTCHQLRQRDKHISSINVTEGESLLDLSFVKVGEDGNTQHGPTMSEDEKLILCHVLDISKTEHQIENLQI